MQHINRRNFLQSSLVMTAAAFTNSAFAIKPRRHLLSFSTLGCPDWSFKEIVDFAAQQQYDGIELRGLRRELDLIRCPEFSTAQNRKDSMRMMKANNLRFADLGSSCTLHFSDTVIRTKNLDEGKRFIDLADEIECPFVRVFPNNFPKEQTKETTVDLIVQGLLELANHAQHSKVTVLLESHGDLVKIDDLENIMLSASHEHCGLIWDIANMWTITKEDPVQAYERLKQYIRHTHIKDAKLVDGKWQYCLLGKGQVPVMDAIDLLHKGGYKGYYSFEWEKLWHPEIEEPAIALADYVTVMKRKIKR